MIFGTQQGLQVGVIVVSLFSLGMTLRYVRTFPRQWPYAVPPVTWLTHVLIFYGCLFYRDFGGHQSGLDFTLWSAVIRLQAAFLIGGVMTMLAYEKLLFRT